MPCNENPTLLFLMEVSAKRRVLFVAPAIEPGPIGLTARHERTDIAIGSRIGLTAVRDDIFIVAYAFRGGLAWGG